MLGKDDGSQHEAGHETPSPRVVNPFDENHGAAQEAHCKRVDADVVVPSVRGRERRRPRAAGEKTEKGARPGSSVTSNRPSRRDASESEPANREAARDRVVDAEDAAETADCQEIERRIRERKVA